MIAPMRDVAPARLAGDRRRWLERLAVAARRIRRRSDPESVHDVRVATRQLEACLDLWRSSLPRRERRRARRALAALRRDLGPAREVRISLNLLRERLAALPPDARVAAAPLEGFLQERLERLEARAARRCTKRKIARVCRRVELAWEGVVLDVESEASFLEAGRTRLAERRRRAQAALREAARGPASEVLHSARVAAKRWRYTLERLAATDGSTELSERPWLMGVQETLGRIQDLAVLHQRAMRLSPRLAPAECEVASEPMRSLLGSFEIEREEFVRKFYRLAASGPGPPPVAGRATSRGRAV